MQGIQHEKQEKNIWHVSYWNYFTILSLNLGQRNSVGSIHPWCVIAIHFFPKCAVAKASPLSPASADTTFLAKLYCQLGDWRGRMKRMPRSPASSEPIPSTGCKAKRTTNDMESSQATAIHSCTIWWFHFPNLLIRQGELEEFPFV